MIENDSVHNLSICIFPYDVNFTALVTETANRSGYYTKSNFNPSQLYSNQSINRTFYLDNATNARSVLFTVQNSYSVKYENYTIISYRYLPTQNKYIQVALTRTDSIGQTVQFLQPVPQQHAVAVLDTNGVLVKNTTNPDVIFCSNVGLAEQCIYNIIIGTQSTDYYASSGSYFNIDSYCSYNNLTLTLTCTYNNSIESDFIISYINLTIFNTTNANNRNIVNSSQITYDNVTANSIQIVLPNLTGTYVYSFISKNTGTVENFQIIGKKLLSEGIIEINLAAKTDYGTAGYIATTLLILAMVLIFMPIPTLAIIASGLSVYISSILGIIQIDGSLQLLILILTAIVAIWAMRR